MSRMTEQKKSPEKELNKMKSSNLPDTKFQTIITRMLKQIRGRMDELNENLNKETVSKKRT